ncbi:MAG: cystathionine gamma-lyase [Saprospiraceae bacterium]|jgi:cystathionine gamma-lyase
MKFGTKVIHAGIEPDPATGAIMTPIYQTSTFAQESPGVHKGYEYARSKNPTRSVLEANLAALENGTDGFCFGSGSAAMDAIFRLLNPGDEVLSTNDLYGGSYRQMTKVHARYGIKPVFIGMEKPKNIEKEITKNTKMIWVETPTNPMLNIIDIKAVCKIARKHKIMVVVDNTFASPYLQTPLDLGADIVMHSATKYLGGHSDVVHGCVIVKERKLAEEVRFIQNATGAVPGPQDCFLVLRGIKTLHLRVERACKNAEKIAKYLQRHPKVANVYYPGLAGHPNHEIAKKQMRHFGGMVSFDLNSDTAEDANKVLSNTHLFTLAESLGGVESLIGHPASMTHGSIPRKDRMKVGLTDSLIRLSVGIEDVSDLLKDLEKALVNV